MLASLLRTIESPADLLRSQIVGIDREVGLLDGTSRPYIYFDNAASTPAFRPVQDTVNEFLEWYSSVHRGSGFKSLLSTRAYDQAREICGAWVGYDRTAHTVVFVKNTTEAINLLASRIPFARGDVVITTAMEHHSNDLPWRPRAHVEYVSVDRDGALVVDELERLLHAYRGRVRLVATTGASNVSGYLPPIHDMAEVAHRYGAQILVDAAQLAPHRRIDMRRPGSARCLDFVAYSAHKMYAPFGSGVLIGPESFFRQGPPGYRGGGTIDIVTLEELHWAAPPERDEAGSPNVAGAVALAASIQTLSTVGIEAIARHEAELTAYALRRLKQVEGVQIYGPNDPEHADERVGGIAFQVNGVPHGKVAAILGFEGGIGVRSGCFCAHPYVIKLLDVNEEAYQAYKKRVLAGDRSMLPGLVRASFGCYNSEAEVDALVEMLERIVAGDYVGEYRVDPGTGDYLPLGFDPAVLDRWFSLSPLYPGEPRER